MNKEFTPKQWVLVRDCYGEKWCLARFSHLNDGDYVAVCGSAWSYCIPYEGNEHLLGTTDEYKEPYEPKKGKWKPKEGEIIYYIYFSNEEGIFKVDKGEWIKGLFQGFIRKYIFQTREECQLFCDKLNKAIKNAIY